MFGGGVGWYRGSSCFYIRDRGCYIEEKVGVFVGQVVIWYWRQMCLFIRRCSFCVYRVIVWGRQVYLFGIVLMFRRESKSNYGVEVVGGGCGRVSVRWKYLSFFGQDGVGNNILDRRLFVGRSCRRQGGVGVVRRFLYRFFFL